MTELEFNTLATHGYNRIPLVAEFFADLDTPLSIYLKLANQPLSCLLESVQGGERFGRYSFIGLPARTMLRAYGQRIEVLTDGQIVETQQGNPLDFIAQYQQRFKVATRPGLPRFCGGLAGYFGYDSVRYIEKRLNTSTSEHAATERAPSVHDPIGTPDILLMLTEALAVVDNLLSKIYLIVYVDPAQPEAYQRGMQRLRDLRTKLRSPAEIPYSAPSVRTDIQREFTRENFEAAVLRCKEYIAAGDCMQIVLAQRLSKPFRDSPLTLYRALRSLNPSPYMYFYHFGDFHVVGASPEILVRQEHTPAGTKVIVRPIAGTRPRGATPEQDAALAKELLADPKEVAEHVMLIDLARNDVGRIAQTGTVKVTERMVIENYSHVMHIVSNVEGLLKPGMSALDVLRATFPAGTLSGAPKIRAMEIIDELEPVKRGIYGGACGYLSFQGDMDVAIAIRTGVVKDGWLHVQAGAGVVADSVPASEWQETENKARAVLRAAEMVQDGLDREP